MDKETTTSVTIDRKTFARLDRLAKSNNVSKKEFLSCALEYFEKYGINPVEHESPAKEMQKLIKRCDQVIAFIRKQEQDFLRPACEAMGSTSMRVTMSMDSILTEKKFSQYQKDNDLFMRDPCKPCRDKGAGFGPGGKGSRSVEGYASEEPTSHLCKAGRCDAKAGEDLLLYRKLYRCERKSRAFR